MERQTSVPEMKTPDLIAKALREEALRSDEIVRLLELSDPGEIKMLFNAADIMRKRYAGDGIYLRGIVEFSNHCKRNCHYCGLRAPNRDVGRYRIPDDEIVSLADRISKAGCTTIVLQSGEDPYYDRQRLCTLIERIKKQTGLAITLSLGERPYEDFRAFKDSGADRYLLRHETSNESLYASLHKGYSLENRLQCLRWLKQIGYETGSGCIVGLPGQTTHDLARDILLLKEYDIDMIGMGPFIPHGSTPLAGHPPGDTTLVLKMIAAARLVTKDTNIPATTAIEVLDPLARKEAFSCGANVYMPVFTPQAYASEYEIYPGKNIAATAQGSVIKSYKEYFSSIGRHIGNGYGFRNKKPVISPDEEVNL